MAESYDTKYVKESHRWCSTARTEEHSVNCIIECCDWRRLHCIRIQIQIHVIDISFIICTTFLVYPVHLDRNDR